MSLLCCSFYIVYNLFVMVTRTWASIVSNSRDGTEKEKNTSRKTSYVKRVEIKSSEKTMF